VEQHDPRGPEQGSDPGRSAGSPATLESVAALAGVSRQTVSNALRHPDRLTPATRDRVLQAVRDSGYRPSLPARQLATRRAHAVAVRADRQQDGISGLVLDTFFHGLAEAGHRSGLRVVLYPQQADEQAELQLIEELLHTQAADAVVLTATGDHDGRPAHLRDAGLVFCAFGRPWGEAHPAHDWVDVDGAHGTGLAVEHALSLGRRRIAFLGWPGESGTGRDRRRGWFEALQRAGLAGAALEAQCVNDAAAAETAAAALLASPEPPDAFVCVSDTVALGAHRAALGAHRAALGAHRAALAEPALVVGFDATPVTEALGLASVAQPIGRAAHACLDLLVPRLRGARPDPQGVLLLPSLRLPG
jgi:DNA-binding LacI/PurR family transcriptional regulator